MEVLVLGLSRSGTMSMRIALQELGYPNVYHFWELFENDAHVESWISALRSKYEGTKPGRITESKATDWNSILGDYSAVTDIPAACFAPELIAAYPSAKIILTTRSSQSWHVSMMRTIHALQTSYFSRFMLLFSDSHIKSVSQVMDLIILHYFRGSIPRHGVQCFEEHNEMVRRVAIEQQRDFLEFSLGDGWAPLCEFLGKPVPEFQFPSVNDSRSFRSSFGLEWSIKDVVLVVSLTVGIFSAVYMNYNRE